MPLALSSCTQWHNLSIKSFASHASYESRRRRKKVLQRHIFHAYDISAIAQPPTLTQERAGWGWKRVGWRCYLKMDYQITSWEKRLLWASVGLCVSGRRGRRKTQMGEDSSEWRVDSLSAVDSCCQILTTTSPKQVDVSVTMTLSDVETS